MTGKSVPTVEEVLARFHRLRITIGLTATWFGYITLSQPGIIKKLESGTYKPHTKSLRKMGEILDALEKGHSIPVSVRREQTENKQVDIPSVKENKPIIKSDLED